MEILTDFKSRKKESESEVTQSCPTLCVGDSPGKNTGVGCHFLLQGILPTQGSDPGIEPRSPTLQADALTSAPPGGNSILQKAKQGGNQQNLFQELHETNATDKQRGSEKLKIKRGLKTLVKGLR